MSVRRFAMLSVLALLSACADAEVYPTQNDPNATARLRIVQGATSSAVDVLVDDKVMLSGVSLAQATALASVTPGTHTIRVRRSGTNTVVGERAVDFGAQDTATVILIDSSSVINAVVLADTGAVPAAGKTKLRVVHFATNAPEIDVWRTQPDYQTLIRVMFPFAYGATSPYLQSDPGDWEVLVTPKDQTTQLHTTGAINIPANQARTVVLIDAPGGGVTSAILNN